MTPSHDPTNLGAIVVVELIFLTLITIGVCVPLVRQTVEMNNWYGIRTPKAFKSEENWYAMNRYGGWVLIISSVIMGAFLVPLAIIFKNNTFVLEMIMASPVLFYTVPLIFISRYGSKLP